MDFLRDFPFWLNTIKGISPTIFLLILAIYVVIYLVGALAYLRRRHVRPDLGPTTRRLLEYFGNVDLSPGSDRGAPPKMTDKSGIA